MQADESIDAWAPAPQTAEAEPAHPAMADRRTATQATAPVVLVQVMRAAAALLVLVGHTQTQVTHVAAVNGENVPHLPFLPGGFGVDLFFGISGFIMVVSSQKLFGTGGARRIFLLRRAIRLVPLYWLATLLYLPLLLLGARGYGGDIGAALATSLLFIPYPTYGSEGGLVFPLHTLGWSLNYEMFFYAVFSLFIVFSAARAAAWVCASMLLIVVAGMALPDPGVVLHFWTQPIILEFAAGILVAQAWLRGWRLERGMAALAIAAALAWVAADPLGLATHAAGASTPNGWARVAGWGLPAAAILAALVSLENARAAGAPWLRAAAVLGDRSYSLYLMHPFALLVVVKAWETLHVQRLSAWSAFHWSALALTLIAASIALAALTYRYVEQPCARGLRRLGLVAGDSAVSAPPIAPAEALRTRNDAASPLAGDLFAATGRHGWRAAVSAAIFEPGFATVLLHRWAAGLQRRGLRRSAKLLWRANVAMSSCHLHLDASIGPGLKLPHPTGVVIGAGARIGERVTIYQHVTVGRARREASFPAIGDDVVIFPNAVVVGGISVGARAVIGAGAVVIGDVPEGAVVAGNPARVVACASST